MEIVKDLTNLKDTLKKNMEHFPETEIKCLYCGRLTKNINGWPAEEYIFPGYCSVSCSIFGRRKENERASLSGYGVPRRYLDCSFENYIISKENAESIESLKNHEIYNTSIFVTGPVGCGKTHLTVAFMRKTMFLKMGEQVFYSAGDIIMKLKSSINSDSMTEMDVFNELNRKDKLIVIDDIGTERPTDYVMQAWYKIIDDRYSGMLPTIYTSNLNISEFAERYGDRMASRLSSGLIIKLKGADYRLKM